VNELKTGKIWDVVIIGGGAAGMMAAGRASERGKSVLLLEKNTSLGKKLLITGGGRCNVTNDKPEVSNLVNSYREAPKALFSLFSQFGVTSTLEFFHARGMDTKLEAEGRIFPASDRAASVWQVLVDNLNQQNVTVQTNTTVLGIEAAADSLIQIRTKNGMETAKSCVVAAGGTSHPETGSTGDGFRWLKALGHSINENSFALVPVALKDTWVASVAGLTLADIRLNVWQDDKRQDGRRGKLLFTHFGISGPTVLNMSSKIGELLQYGEVRLELDLLPDLDHGQLKMELHKLLMSVINKKIKNSLTSLIPSGLVDIVLNLAQIDGEKANNSVTKEERTSLIKTLKALPLTVKQLLGADKAIVSSGGVKVDEVNFKTMMSKLVPNLYIVGDVLDIDRPSGGYSLQLCWASGFVAGDNC